MLKSTLKLCNSTQFYKELKKLISKKFSTDIRVKAMEKNSYKNISIKIYETRVMFVICYLNNYLFYYESQYDEYKTVIRCKWLQLKETHDFILLYFLMEINNLYTSINVGNNIVSIYLFKQWLYRNIVKNKIFQYFFWLNYILSIWIWFYFLRFCNFRFSFFLLIMSLII